jgi:uncharacterized protein YjbI with pentapeptide repeats
MDKQQGSQLSVSTHPTTFASGIGNIAKTVRLWAIEHKRPRLDDLSGWRHWWGVHGQSWRRMPEIDKKRQRYLDKQRVTANYWPDIYPFRIYPFKDIRLTRADVEWLLATHENGRGPVIWSDESHRKREGLNLRGANLRGEDLDNLPLAKVDLDGARLEEAKLSLAYLEGAIFDKAQLEKADLAGASLDGASFMEAQANEASFYRAKLKGSILVDAQLRKVNFGFAQLQDARLDGAQLEGADLSGACLNDGSLLGAQLENANLSHAQLDRTFLFQANLRRASLTYARLWGTKLVEAQLEGTDLGLARLQEADLRGATLDATTRLERTELNAKTCLADVVWNGAALAQIEWDKILMLGDESKLSEDLGKRFKHGRGVELREYRTAVRANRQLAMALGDQGMTEEANRFAYRAQVLQRKVLWKEAWWGKVDLEEEVELEKGETEAKSLRQQFVKVCQRIVGLWHRAQKFGAWLFSLFLDWVAGYGYKPGKGLRAYLITIVGFMILYLVNAQFVSPHLSWDQALILSVSSFHGRGFLPPDIVLDSAYARLAAFEAVFGLLIEVSFIATFTQRFFGK